MFAQAHTMQFKAVTSFSLVASQWVTSGWEIPESPPVSQLSGCCDSELRTLPNKASFPSSHLHFLLCSANEKGKTV